MSIFFLMCSERSGSNLITKLLNGHKNICGPSTKHIINPVARNLFRYGKLSEAKNWEVLLNDIHRLMSIDFSAWKKEFSLESLKSLAVPGDIKSLIQNIFLEEARANGKQHVFIKENHVYEFFPFLMANFPESKFIYQTRDPRDMALSWKKNPDHPGGVVKAARQWKQDQQQSLKNYHLLEHHGKAYMIKYEDLTKDSKTEARNILDFMGIPFDKGIFNFHEDELTQKNAGMQNSWRNLSKGIISDNSNKYTKELSSEEIKAIEKICWYEMLLLGYIPEFFHDEISKISEPWLEAFHQNELSEIELCQSKGVKDNIKAKARFYQR